MWRLLVSCTLALFVGCATSNDEMKLRAFLNTRVGNVMVRPTVELTDNITVTAGLTLIDVEVDERNDLVTVNGWLSLDWYNKRISWDDIPHLAHVEETRMGMADMWMPDLFPYNKLPSAGANWLLPTPALVKRDGKVLVVPPVTFAVRCERSLADRKDRITCPIKLGSWTYSEQELDLQPGSDVVDVSSFISNGRWAVESSSVKRKEKTYPCCPEKYVSLDMELVLKPQRC